MAEHVLEKLYFTLRQAIKRESRWVQISVLPLSSCGNLGKILTLSVPQSLHLWNGDSNSIYFTVSVWGANVFYMPGMYNAQ